MHGNTSRKNDAASLGIAAAAVAVLITLSISPTSSLYAIELYWELGVVAIMAVLARLLGVRTPAGDVMALDAVFYISAVFVFGLLTAGWLLLLVLFGDTLVRLLRDRSYRAQHTAFLEILAQGLRKSGLPLLGLLVVALSFNLDRNWPIGESEALLTIPLTASVFFGSRYAMRGKIGRRARGLEPERLGLLDRAMVTELLLVPLTLAMVVGYGSQGFGLYLLFGASCLTFCVVFREAAISNARLHDRIEELAVLNKVSRSISSSLERRVLIANLAHEMLRLVRDTSRFMIATIDRQGDTITYELYDEELKEGRRVSAPRGDGLAGWVIKNRAPLRLCNLQKQYSAYSEGDACGDSQFQAWLGAPLIIYGDVMGVIAMQSKIRNAYNGEHVRLLTTVADQAAVALENSRLYELATIDGLTGLLVRRQFEQRLEEEWARAKRYGNDFAVGILDLDDFKRLNDSFGHHAGDVALRSAAAVLRGSMRGVDLCGRYGGEEFAFLLPRTRLQEAMTMAERIRADIERMRIKSGDDELRLTASIGLVAFSDANARTSAELLMLADEAMYRAKGLGKNQVAYGTEGDGAPRIFTSVDPDPV